MNAQEFPRIGIAVIIIRNGKVLLGKRRNVCGEGSWHFPGGHLEFKEEFEECARREVLEETGLEIKNIRFAIATNNISKEWNTHYITLFFTAEHLSGEARNLEQDRCEELKWFDWHALPEPKFPPFESLIKKNYDPFKHAS